MRISKLSSALVLNKFSILVSILAAGQVGRTLHTANKQLDLPQGVAFYAPSANLKAPAVNSTTSPDLTSKDDPPAEMYPDGYNTSFCSRSIVDTPKCVLVASLDGSKDTVPGGSKNLMYPPITHLSHPTASTNYSIYAIYVRYAATKDSIVVLGTSLRDTVNTTQWGPALTQTASQISVPGGPLAAAFLVGTGLGGFARDGLDLLLTAWANDGETAGSNVKLAIFLLQNFHDTDDQVTTKGIKRILRPGNLGNGRSISVDESLVTTPQIQTS